MLVWNHIARRQHMQELMRTKDVSKYICPYRSTIQEYQYFKKELIQNEQAPFPIISHIIQLKAHNMFPALNNNLEILP